MSTLDQRPDDQPRPGEGPSADYQAAWEFLRHRINYERQPVAPYGERHFKLARMQELLNRLGNPERDVPILHVAGTKGKGSTVAMTAGMLSAASLRTGVYSSPHLERVEERISIDGRPIAPDRLAALIWRLAPLAECMDRETAERCPEETGPTYFELLTAVALLHFAEQKVDAVVLEVGLGGRLDSTNVCRPVVTAITSISFDHTRQLGSTLAEIAREKAGIAKPGVPMISGVTEREPAEVIAAECARAGAPLAVIDRDFGYAYRGPVVTTGGAEGAVLDFWSHGTGPAWRLDEVVLRMAGRHQAANAAVALAMIERLRQSGWAISETAIRQGLAQAMVPARVEIVGREPTIVLDAAHNVASIAALVETLAERFPNRPRWLIFGTTDDKDVAGMLARLLPEFGRVVFTRYWHNPRAVPPEDLQHLAGQIRPPGAGEQRHLAADPAAAWSLVQSQAESRDLICITGSFFLAAEMRPWCTGQPLGARAGG